MKFNPFIVVFLMLWSSIAFAAKEVTIGVNGMVCGFCAQGIARKFSADPAVEKVKVSLENKVVSLQLKEGKSISDDSINNLLKDAGYTVSKIERK
jgi:mercuric ion binding protein